MNKEKATAFISYSQRDERKVLFFANCIGRLGLKVWMDKKQLIGGQKIAHEIARSISKSTFYFVFLSKNSIQSNWVEYELNLAMKWENDKGAPKVIPILIEKCEVPIEISGHSYIEAGESLDKAKNKIKQTVQSYLSKYEPVKEISVSPRDIFREIVSPFLPLHLSLQAFFGISKDEKGNWVDLREAKELSDEFKKAFPNKEAFLLIEEAKWDFYAEIGARLGNWRVYEKDKGYSSKEYALLPPAQKHIEDLIDELFEFPFMEAKKAIDYCNFKNFYGEVITGEVLKWLLKRFVQSDELSQVCAILTNVNYLQDEVNSEKIPKGREILRRLGYYDENGNLVMPVYLKDKSRHSKKPLREDKQSDSYKILINQLEEFGVIRAKKVIEGIEKMADGLEQVVEILNKEQKELENQ